MLPRFEADFVTVLYEADMDAIDGIHQANREAIVIPACLAEADSQKTLYVTVNPGGTSLLRPSAVWNDRYVPIIGIDFDFPGGIEIIDERELAARSLDSLLASLGDRCPPPDFLSLDVQGYEHAVLMGAKRTLETSVCGLIVEVEFVELYQGQKRFQEICDLLGGLGYAFVRFLEIGELAGPSAPLGFRSGGYQTWADALFLRRPQKFNVDDSRHSKLCKKLAFFSIVFGVTELAIECFELLQEANPQTVFDETTFEYEGFLSKLFNSYTRAAKIFPPQFSNVLSAENRLRFSIAPGLEQWPEILDGLLRYGEGYRSELLQLQQATDTKFETVLRQYGFVDLAERVKLARRDQSSKLDATIQRATAAKRSPPAEAKSK